MLFKFAQGSGATLSGQMWSVELPHQEASVQNESQYVQAPFATCNYLFASDPCDNVYRADDCDFNVRSKTVSCDAIMIPTLAFRG
jgi:hypothetical protein